ncbi:protease inhibitor I42 family protein [Luteimicrobium sp. DT211]|uniref:protease inhibitor I42 family protein n=1 Tax=Luteimicrobium sp. DT211 TaxID=3393412 RepID=UPI003CF1D049
MSTSPLEPDAVIEARVGVPVALPLADAGPTGYSWRFELPDGVHGAGSTDAVAPAPGLALGTPSGVLPLVTVDRPGTYDVTAVLARPWEQDGVRTLTVRIVGIGSET